MKESRIAIVTAVNDRRVFAANLAASSCVSEGVAELIVESGHPSASRAYNAGLSRCSEDIVVFAHQDVYLPRGWEQRLLAAVAAIESSGRCWGVLGVIGMRKDGRVVGRVWSSGLNGEIGEKAAGVPGVVSIDELVIVLRRASGLCFDETLPGYHLYGADIVLAAGRGGYEACVFDGPVVHNSIPVMKLDRMYCAAYRHIQRKWQEQLPVPNLVVSITKGNWMLRRRRAGLIVRRLMGVFGLPKRHSDPRRLAIRLGYEE